MSKKLVVEVGYFVPDGNKVKCVSYEELLAQPEQPEQKLMTDRAIIQACPDHYCDMEKEAFKVGIKWHEKYVARIGVYSNE